jgi:hypothetical protein
VRSCIHQSRPMATGANIRSYICRTQCTVEGACSLTAEQDYRGDQIGRVPALAEWRGRNELWTGSFLSPLTSTVVESQWLEDAADSPRTSPLAPTRCIESRPVLFSTAG